VTPVLRSTARYAETYGGVVPEPLDGEPVWISDEELTALALAADPDAPVPDDAVPFHSSADLAFELLPTWYMPAPSLRRDRKRTVVFAGIVFALLVIDVMGLCVTYGFPDPVWK
jgi:hypothetical protein